MAKKEALSFNFFDKISFWIFLGIIFLLPLFFIPNLDFSINLSKGFLLIIGFNLALFFWLIGRIVEGRISLPKSWSLGFLFLFLLAVLISASFSEVKFISFFGQNFEIDTFFSILALFLSLFLGATLFQKKERLFYFLVTVLLSSLIVFIFQALNLFFDFQSFKQLEFLKNGTLVGSFGNLAILSGFITIWLLTFLEFFNFSKILKSVLTLFLILVTLFLILIDFNLVWLTILFYSLFLFVYKLSLKLTQSSKQSNLSWPIFSFSLFLISLLFLLSPFNFLRPYLPINDSEIRPNLKTSFFIAQKELARNPVLGLGPNRFSKSWQEFKPDDLYQTDFFEIDFNHSYSFLTNSSVTFGFLGATIFILFFLNFLWLFFKKLKKKFFNGDYFLFLLLFSSLYFWFLTLFYWPGTLIFTLTWVITGILIGYLVNNKEIQTFNFNFLKDPRQTFFTILIFILIASFSVYVIFRSTKIFLANVYWSRASLELKTIGSEVLDEAEQKIISSIKLNSKSDLYYRSLAEIYLYRLNLLLNSPQEEPNEKIQEIFNLALNNAKLAIKTDKTNYLNWFLIGSIYERVRATSEMAYPLALESYKEAKRLNPKKLSLDLSLAKLEAAQGNFQEAKLTIDQVLIKKPDYGEALNLKEQLNNFLISNDSNKD